VEAVVDHGLGARALVIVGDGRGDRGAAVLRREWNDGRGAAERRGHRAAVEIVRRHDAHARELLDVAMAVDAAGQHVAALRVEVALARRELRRHGDDLFAGDADVAARGLVRGRHRTVANGQVHSTSILGMICRNNGANMLRILVASVALIIAGLVSAQSYPARQVRIVVPFPPGGTSDILARTIGARLSAPLGQPVVVENRPGAGGNIAADHVAKSPPDGYTLIMGTSSLAISQSLYRKLSYDLIQDFAPVTQAVNYTNLLVVHPSAGVSNVAELLALARAKPGALSYDTAGNGTPPHMTGELFKSYTGVNILHIPYKGGAPAIADLVAGQIPMMFDNVPPLLPHVRSGRIKALAVTSLARIQVLPDVPTLHELGLKDFDAVGWNGLLAPAGTPREIVSRLHTEVVRVLRNPEVREQLTSQGADVVGNSPEEFAAWIRVEVKKWAEVVRVSGAKV